MSLTSPDGSPFTSGVSQNSDVFSLSHVDGYDYEFDPPLDVKYECPICLSILKEPRQTNCGHRFCRDCILRWLRESGTRCPIDNETLSEKDIFPDNFARREILNCRVKCPNHKVGCEMKVILCQLPKHLEECPLSLKPCPYNCPNILPLRDMKEHVEKYCQNRFVTCSLCNIKLKANEIAAHTMICPKAAVKCQYCCKEIKRDEMDHHISNICEKCITPCPFQLLGCNSLNERCKENDHLIADIPSHLKQLSHVMVCLLKQLEDVALKINQSDIKTNQPHSGLVDEINRALPHLKISHQYSTPRVSSTASNSSTPGQQHLSNSNWNSVNFSDHSGEGSPHSSYSDCCRRITPPHSFPLAGSLTLASGEIPDKRNSRSSLASAPQSASGNPGFSNFNQKVTPVSSFLPQNNTAVPLSSSSNGQHYLPNGNFAPFSPTSTSSDKINCKIKSAEDCSHYESMGEEKIHTFVNGLQALCHNQNQELIRQQQVIDHMQQQLCQMQRSNQELVKRVRDLESPNIHYDTRSHCGEFYWHISDYCDLRKKASNGETLILHSSPFLTSPWGYKLCIRANFTGFVNSDQEHYLSLFVHFMQERNDHLLRWPFKGQIVLSVMDQNEVYSKRQPITETLEAKPHLEAFKQPTSARNHKGFGFTEFVTLSTLENGSYICNDSIVIRAHVFPEN